MPKILKLTARQVRLLTNAAIDATPSIDGEDEEEDGWTRTGEKKVTKLSKEASEAERRKHRQLLRKMGIKPSHDLAERLKDLPERDLKKSSILSKGKPSMGKDQGPTTIGQFLNSARTDSSYKISDKAKRIMELGGY